MVIRLAGIDEGLVKRIEQADDGCRRRIAVSAAEYALQHGNLQHERTDALMEAIRNGRVGDTRERDSVENLVEELDISQFDIHDRHEQGDATDGEDSAAFRKARAASAVHCAADADALEAALDSVYEAAATVDDPGPLLRSLHAVLTAAQS